jgi:outer membrane protein assembly factor BamB
MPESKRGSSWALWASVGLFVVFVVLAFYHKYREALAAIFEVHDTALMAELASATILDDPEPGRADWPQWRGERRDGYARADGLLLDWRDGDPKRLWQITCGRGYSSFAVGGGRAYTSVRDANQEAVVCLNMENGDELWQFAYPCTYTSDQGDGPRSTPTLDREPRPALYGNVVLPGDRVYTVGADGKFYCLDAATGKEVWQRPHDLLAEFGASNLQWGTSFSPLIEGNLVITTPGGPDASVVAFDKYTGEKKWASQSDKAGYSSPLVVNAAGRRQLLVFAGKVLLSLSPEDGSLNWRYPWAVTADVNAATPTVFRAEKDGRTLDYVFISTGYSCGSALLKLDKDAKGNPTAQPVYTTHEMNNHFSSSVRRGDYLYGFNEAKLTCLDLKTGKKRWDADGFQKGSLLRAGDHLIVLGEKGDLALFDATPDPESSRPRLLANDVFDQRNPRCWTMPVLADGKLLLRNQYQTRTLVESEIICLDLRKSK